MDNTEKEYSGLINKLKSLKSVKPSDKFREKVAMEMIPSLPNPAPWFFLSTLSLRLAIASFLLVLLGGSGIVFAAEKSRPGDLLYPVKRAVEKVQVTLTSNPAVKTLLHINNANKRVDELKETVKKDDNKEIKNITSDYEKQVKEAVKEIQKVKDEKKDITKKVNEQLENQGKTLEKIQQVAPSTFVPAIQKAIETSKEEQKTLEQLPEKTSGEDINKEILNIQPIDNTSGSLEGIR